MVDIGTMREYRNGWGDPRARVDGITLPESWRFVDRTTVENFVVTPAPKISTPWSFFLFFSVWPEHKQQHRGI